MPTATKKIHRIDPILFDAIHLASLAFGGIGGGRDGGLGEDAPVCLFGTARWVAKDNVIDEHNGPIGHLYENNLSREQNDKAVIGFNRKENRTDDRDFARIDFLTLCDKLGLDITE